MANNNDVAAQWPPASPKDVLRLTPRKTPINLIHSSPLRKATNVSPTRGRRGAPPIEEEDSDATTSEEDEEALQLQLKAIEMKLKLKRLQKEKKRKAEKATGSTQATIASGRTTPPPSFERAAPDVQVPVSPSPRKKTMAIDDANPPASPSRVLLGIDKGLKARDISLKRAPGMTNLIAEPPRKPQFTSSTSSTSSALRNVTKETSDPFASKSIPAAKSFSERIAEQRAGITAKEIRAKENEKLRSKGWNLESSDSTVSTTVTSSTVTKQESHAMVLSRTTSLASSRPTGVHQQPTGRLQTQRTQSSSSASTSSTLQTAEPPKSTTLTSISNPTTSNSITTSTTTESEATDQGAGFDSFSSLHLTRRLLAHTQLARHLNEKEIFHLPRLLKTVHSPDYDPPDVAGDWVVMGIVASKSEPRDVAREGAGKYIVIQITDLKWEVELFCFGSAFQKYYRLRVGTVLAILNPNIMKPRNQDSGKFSLTLSDNNDTLLEIGTARDLGACKARKRDGKECGTWVDKRRTEFCDFHVEQTISKVRSSRPEVMTMGKLYSPPRKGEGLRPKRNFMRGGKQERDDGLLPLKEGIIPDLPVKAGGGGGNVYVTKFSTAKLIDNHNITGDPSWQREKEEKLKRMLARREKEREITRGLLAVGNANTGMDYLKANLEDENGKGVALMGVRRSTADGRGVNTLAAVGGGTSAADARAAAIEEFKSHAAKSAADVSLSPIKSKRKSADITARDAGSPSPPPGAGEERAIKRSRPDSGGVGWAQRDVKKHLERNVALTSTGGLKQTQLGWKTRSRSRSPVKRLPPTQEVDDNVGAQADVLLERPSSPNKSNLKNSSFERRDSKSVKFAPIPQVDDDSDDDLEILGM
ncbi:hypothetical protein H072_4596 [Dactylellina haptotyla CBS 200.50]|uniref:Uncharacterized protein n=1 Tax=Dactylellina haptotyla (strain CBS 200.50) TaxID=1284197 RepID=S8AEX5_DACHA|nr:hypothetical protein H072_4596 [Dactylellina haptotyla CBS 200.50]